jgi:hypothetical protein
MVAPQAMAVPCHHAAAVRDEEGIRYQKGLNGGDFCARREFFSGAR